HAPHGLLQGQLLPVPVALVRLQGVEVLHLEPESRVGPPYVLSVPQLAHPASGGDGEVGAVVVGQGAAGLAGDSGQAEALHQVGVRHGLQGVEAQPSAVHGLQQVVG
ncbi:MAG: hypothetical protein ACK55I_06410, partial [bacterium]